MAACGGDDESSSTNAVATGTGEDIAGSTIDFLSFEGFEYPTAMKAWLNANDVELKEKFVSDNETIKASVVAAEQAGLGIDLITYFEGYGPEYRELGIVQTLDESQIPNLEGLFDYFKSDVGNYWVSEEGDRSGVPMTFASLGITYDSTKVPEPTDYDIMFEPKYKGRVAMVNDVLSSYNMTSNVLGMDMAKIPRDRFPEVEDYLRRVLAQTNGISPSYGDAANLLVSDEVDIVWPGLPFFNTAAAAAGNPNVLTIIPEDTIGYTAVDSWAIASTADNVDATYAFINETLDPEVSAAEAEYLVAGTPVKAAVPLLSKESAEAVGINYNDLDEVFERAPVRGNPPQESTEYVTLDEVKSSWQTILAGL